MKNDPYVLGHKLLSIDLDSVSLRELSLLEYVCTEILDSVNKEFEKRGYEGGIRL